MAAAIALLVVTGAAAATVYGGVVGFTLVAAPVGLVVGLVNWRWAVYGLLAYLPLSGIAILASYDPKASSLERGIPTVLKDLVFVAPAYLGFLLGCWRSRRWPSLGGLPLLTVGALAVLVLVQALNPELPNRLVGLIGIKVWLFYIPLYVLGFHLVRSRDSLRQALAVMALTATVPAVVGIVEAVLLRSGEKELVYSAYGDAAASATQQYAVSGDGTTLFRIPSTFSFFVQYFGFLMAMLGVAWSCWRAFLVPAGRGRFGLAMVVLVMIAAFLSGSRNAYVSVPIVIVVALLLSPDERRRLRSSRGAQVSGAVAALGLTGAMLALGVLQKALPLIPLSIDSVLIGGFRQSMERGHTLLGNGTGANTPPARYALPPDATNNLIDSWMVKALVELGIVGLVLTVLVLARVLITVVRAHRSIVDPRLAAASAGILAVLVWVLLNTVKGFFLDVDPISVYFWLFAGVLSGIAALGVRERGADGQAVPDDRPAVATV